MSLISFTASFDTHSNISLIFYDLDLMVRLSTSSSGAIGGISNRSAPTSQWLVSGPGELEEGHYCRRMDSLDNHQQVTDFHSSAVHILCVGAYERDMDRAHVMMPVNCLRLTYSDIVVPTTTVILVHINIQLCFCGEP